MDPTVRRDFGHEGAISRDVPVTMCLGLHLESLTC
jgi:hypothetical protein